jgi:hypothetical protein
MPIPASIDQFVLERANPDGTTQYNKTTLAAIPPEVIGSSATQQTLTDGATVSWDTGLGAYGKLTLGGNRTIAAPTNLVNGRMYALELIQDATGSRTVTWNAAFVWSGGTAPTLTATAAKRDIIRFVASNGKLYGVGNSLNFA